MYRARSFAASSTLLPCSATKASALRLVSASSSSCVRALRLAHSVAAVSPAVSAASRRASSSPSCASGFPKRARIRAIRASIAPPSEPSSGISAADSLCAEAANVLKCGTLVSATLTSRTGRHSPAFPWIGSRSNTGDLNLKRLVGIRVCPRSVSSHPDQSPSVSRWSVLTQAAAVESPAGSSERCSRSTRSPDQPGVSASEANFAMSLL